MKFLLLVPGCLLAMFRSVGADELDDRLREFRVAAQPLVEQVRTDSAKPENANKARDGNYVLDRLARLLAGSGPMQPELMRLFLAEIAGQPALSPELQALLTSLGADLPKLLDQRNEQHLTDTDRFVKETATSCLAAKSEGELDPVSRQGAELLNGFRDSVRGDERAQRVQRRLQAAIQAISIWQDYLAFLALGDANGGARVLRRLIENTDYPIIARAEIEKRLTRPEPDVPAVPQALAVLREVRKIDDLAPALEKARVILSTGRDVQQKSQLYHFDRLAAAHLTLQAGFVGEALQIVNSTGSTSGPTLSADWQGELARLRGLSLLMLLPRYLLLPDQAAPRESEAASDYLLRLAGDLVSTRRFSESVRVLETYRTVAFANSGQGPSWIQADIEALQSFAAAERLAAIGSWAEAIRSYRRSAGPGGKFAPVTEASQRLEALTKAHPDDAKAAERLAEIEAQYQRITRDISNDATRAMENRLPPDVRARMGR